MFTFQDFRFPEPPRDCTQREATLTGGDADGSD
jgi:hypothetical protein